MQAADTVVGRFPTNRTDCIGWVSLLESGILRSATKQHVGTKLYTSRSGLHSAFMPLVEGSGLDNPYCPAKKLSMCWKTTGSMFLLLGLKTCISPISPLLPRFPSKIVALESG